MLGEHQSGCSAKRKWMETRNSAEMYEATVVCASLNSCATENDDTRGSEEEAEGPLHRTI